MSINDLVKLLNRRYAEDVHYVSGIFEDIQDLIDEGELEEMPEISIEACEKEEIERGYYEYSGVDTVTLDQFINNPKEKSAYILGIEFDDHSNLIWINIVPNVDAYSFYVGED